MRTNWKVIVLTAMFVIQTVLVFTQDRLFNEAMEIKRERVERTQAISSVMQEMQYEVSSYVRNVVVLLLISNFGMLVVAASSKPKDAA
jgi:hypothetical protein